MDLSTWLLLVGIGAVVGVDAISWPQAMISRPLVTGTIGGALMGDPGAGLLVGGVLELMSFRHPPYGGAPYPDAGPAGLISGVAWAMVGRGLPALVGVLGAGWAIGWIGSRSVQLLRAINTRLARDPAWLAARPRRIETRQRLGVLLDATRAAVLTGSFVVPVTGVAGLANSILSRGGAAATLAATSLVMVVAGAVGAGSRIGAGGHRSWPLLVAGAMTALALTLVF